MNQPSYPPRNPPLGEWKASQQTGQPAAPMTDPTLLRMQRGRGRRRSAALTVGLPAAIVVAALGAAAVWGLTRPNSFSTNAAGTDNPAVAAAAASNALGSADQARSAAANAHMAAASADQSAARKDMAKAETHKATAAEVAQAAPAPVHHRAAHATRHARAANEGAVDTAATMPAPMAAPPAPPAAPTAAQPVNPPTTPAPATTPAQP